MNNKKSIAKTLDSRIANTKANSSSNLDNISQAFIEIENEDWTGLTMKEAAKLVERSYPMMKVLISNNRIKYKKIKGKYGDEIRINEKSLLDYYNPEKSNANTLDNSMDNSLDNSLVNNQASLDNDENIKIFDKFVLGMEKQIEFLSKEIGNKNMEIERLHKLLENQQTLNLQTVNLLNSKTEEQKPNLLQRIFRLKK
jgi:hypothetical protein